MTESVEQRGNSYYQVRFCDDDGRETLAPGELKAHLVIHNFFSQTGRHHLLQSFLFALCLSSQLGRAVTEPGDVILGGRHKND